jgi:hypothetical protein
MYAELAQYVAPKRKAVEHSGVAEEERLTIRLLRCDREP